MNTRTINYIDPSEDPLQLEIDIALTKSMDESFKSYCNTIVSLYAMANIDILNYPVKKVIHYVDDE